MLDWFARRRFGERRRAASEGEPENGGSPVRSFNCLIAGSVRDDAIAGKASVAHASVAHADQNRDAFSAEVAKDASSH
jgi:hypothetical protein